MFLLPYFYSSLDHWLFTCSKDSDRSFPAQKYQWYLITLESVMYYFILKRLKEKKTANCLSLFFQIFNNSRRQKRGHYGLNMCQINFCNLGCHFNQIFYNVKLESWSSRGSINLGIKLKYYLRYRYTAFSFLWIVLIMALYTEEEINTWIWMTDIPQCCEVE